MDNNNPYPRETIRVMTSQIMNLRSVIRHHFARRHTARYSAGNVRNWIAELRRIDRASGYSACVRQVADSAYPAYRYGQRAVAEAK